MMASIRRWWDGLTVRERWLVGIAAGLAAAVLLWLATFGVAAALSDAREAHGEAVDRAAGIAARVDAIEALQSAPRRTATASAATVDIVVAQSAAEKGFTLSRNEAQGGSAASIAIANARAPALLAWLGELEAMGIMAGDLSLRPNADGTVALTATLRRPS